MNEEKEDIWFVWEKALGGGYNPAIYRGQPMTGGGVKADADRFLLKIKLPSEEQHWGLKQLSEKYPKPEQSF